MSINAKNNLAIAMSLMALSLQILRIWFPKFTDLVACIHRHWP
jgi:hypothetical protein